MHQLQLYRRTGPLHLTLQLYNPRLTYKPIFARHFSALSLCTDLLASHVLTFLPQLLRRRQRFVKDLTLRRQSSTKTLSTRSPARRVHLISASVPRMVSTFRSFPSCPFFLNEPAHFLFFFSPVQTLKNSCPSCVHLYALLRQMGVHSCSQLFLPCLSELILLGTQHPAVLSATAC